MIYEFDHEKLRDVAGSLARDVPENPDDLPANSERELGCKYPPGFRGIIPSPDVFAGEMGLPMSGFSIVCMKRAGKDEIDVHDDQGEVYFVLGPPEGMHVLIGEERKRYAPGDVCIIPPGVRHLADIGAEYLLYKIFSRR